MIFGGLVTISNYANNPGGGAAPSGNNFMITEDGLNLMIDESGNLMITE
jgi:hypothetical protein